MEDPTLQPPDLLRSPGIEARLAPGGSSPRAPAAARCAPGGPRPGESWLTRQSPGTVEELEQQLQACRSRHCVSRSLSRQKRTSLRSQVLALALDEAEGKEPLRPLQQAQRSSAREREGEHRQWESRALVLFSRFPSSEATESTEAADSALSSQHSKIQAAGSLAGVLFYTALLRTLFMFFRVQSVYHFSH